MALLGLNTTKYGGEVQEHVLTIATTGNELVGRGLIMVIPGINSSTSIPRVKTGSMLQKRKEDPTKEDSKGDFTYSEQTLVPKDMMAFTLFNPRAFEHIWRVYQPTDDLVFRQLPPNIQNLLLDELLKQVGNELGYQYINGEYKEGSDDAYLMNGILTQAAKNPDVVKVKTVGTTMLQRLKELRTQIPVTMRNNANLRILMSVEDFDQYDDELTQLANKGAAPTDINQERYKGIPFEVLTQWPQGLIVATLCDSGMNGNLFAAVNLQNDENVIQIDKWANASELYFFKMLMKADTQIGFGEEFIALDWRADGAFKSVVEG
ncbi:hypothetical protein HMPREF9447_01703 [Bacteroides oleiciplenus YIT 12058]|uniref:Major capsid protein n=1 Tax=Bacteroides oleiciplenus YIT 12058 TaxID=742727 RepID=K9EMC0_9BACE|nr:hypothetical protein HMPREF9447_01703 [Bacteroides oleiciplenus YIT 12058]